VVADLLEREAVREEPPRAGMPYCMGPSPRSVQTQGT